MEFKILNSNQLKVYFIVKKFYKNLYLLSRKYNESIII